MQDKKPEKQVIWAEFELFSALEERRRLAESGTSRYDRKTFESQRKYIELCAW